MALLTSISASLLWLQRPCQGWTNPSCREKNIRCYSRKTKKDQNNKITWHCYCTEPDTMGVSDGIVDFRPQLPFIRPDLKTCKDAQYFIKKQHLAKEQLGLSLHLLKEMQVPEEHKPITKTINIIIQTNKQGTHTHTWNDANHRYIKSLYYSRSYLYILNLFLIFVTL